jgi:choline-sulfatase
MEPKNLIVLVSDEHSRRYSGCYGDPIAKTPNIDRLAASGTRFSRAYTPSPICTAARASLATGLWVHQTGCNSSVEAYDGTIPSWGHHLIEAGHQVVSFGKIGYLRANSSNGFSREFLPIHNLNGLGWMGGLLRDPVYIPDDAVEAQEFANHIGCGESDYTKYDRAVCDTACAWLRANGDSQDRPWVMFVSFISPHYPLIAPKEFYDLYDEEAVGLPHRQDALPDHPVMQEYRRFFNFNDHLDERLTRQARRAYYGLCSFTDYLIGRVMSTLETQGQRPWRDAGKSRHLDEDAHVRRCRGHPDDPRRRWGSARQGRRYARLPGGLLSDDHRERGRLAHRRGAGIAGHEPLRNCGRR